MLVKCVDVEGRFGENGGKCLSGLLARSFIAHTSAAVPPAAAAATTTTPTTDTNTSNYYYHPLDPSLLPTLPSTTTSVSIFLCANTINIMYNGNGYNHNQGGSGRRNVMNYDELNYPDLISASIQTINASQLPIILHNNNRRTSTSVSSSSSSSELRIPPMPPPVSNAMLQRIKEDLIFSSFLSRVGADRASSTGTGLQPRRYTFEVEKEILARDAERRWNESTSSVHDTSEDNNVKSVKELAKGGPVDAPAAHEENGVDASGCPMMSNASSSYGEFLRWVGDRK